MTARSGFTLFEILIALAIAAMVSTGLFTLLGQSMRSFNSVDSMTTLDRVLMVTYERLDRDIQGLTVPMFGNLASPDKGAEEGIPSKQGQQKKKLMEDYLVLQQDDNNLKELSFITNNPVHFYGVTTPLLARVMYRIEPSSEGRYRLMRGQSFELDAKAVQDYFMLLDNIVSLRVRCVFAKTEEKKEEQKEVQQQEKKQQKQKPKRPTYTFIDARQLPFEEQDEHIMPIPITYVFEGAVWDDIYNMEQPFTFRYHVPTWQSSIAIVSKSKKQNPLAVPAKPNQQVVNKQEPADKVAPVAQPAGGTHAA